MKRPNFLPDRRARHHALRTAERAARAVLRHVLPARARAFVRRRLGSKPASDDDWAQQHGPLAKEVSALSKALWMGFTTDAVAELERIRRAPTTPRQPVIRACETLARWYTTTGRFELALDRLVHARALSPHAVGERLSVLEHHVLAELGHFKDADLIFERWGVPSPNLHLMQANVLLRRANAGEISRTEADERRLQLIDSVFSRRSLQPLSECISGDTLTFSSLGMPVESAGFCQGSDAGPKVSIIMPAYNAADTLRVSVTSMLRQRHANLEVVIVDDASTDDTYRVAKSLESEDSRVRVVQHARNMGAYAARNTGLEAATGDYVTVHDADDWSHPEMLERQLGVLRTGGCVGTFSRLARVDSNLAFQLRPYRPMLEPIHWNYTSLLLPTETLRAFGGWDVVRAHADSDLIIRLRDYYGKDSLAEAETAVPLSFFLVGQDNLTEATGTGLRSVDFGARKEYTEQAEHWRRTTFPAGEIPSYRQHPRQDANTPFYCPRPLATSRSEMPTYDLVIGSDLALLGGTRNCNLAYLKCAQQLGMRVGIFNMPRYRMRRTGSIDASYRELFRAGAVDLLTPEDDVTAKVLLVHHPPVLRHLFDRYPRVTADQHYLLVNQLPWQLKDYSDIQYEVSQVIDHYARAFDAAPQWIPITPRVRRYLSGEIGRDALYGEDWYPIVPWQVALPGGSGGAPRELPVVGRHSRDHWTKWPEQPEVLATCYLADTDYEVRLLGGASSAESVLGYRPRNWQIYPFDSQPVGDFLEGIDIFVHFHHSLYIEEFGRNVAEAMALGIPCVLPTEYAETFEDAAAYAEPGDIAGTAASLWLNRDSYWEYSERGTEFVRKHSAVEVGMGRIERLLG